MLSASSSLTSIIILILLLESGGYEYSRNKVNTLLRIATYNNPLAGLPGVSPGNLGLMENDLLQWLSQELNFTYLIVVPKDVRQIGTLQPNRSWTGTLGLLAKGEADASVSFGIRNWNRHSNFDLTSPIITDNIGIMVPYPTVGINPTALADVYTNLTWSLILLSTLATIGYLWLLGRIKPSDRIEFGGLAIHIMGVMLGQGGWIRSGSVRFQLVFGMWLLGLLVISYGYTGSLISRMSAPSINYLARSLEEVATNPRVMPYTVKDSATHAEFKESTIAAFQAVNNKFLDNPSDLLLSSYDGIVETIHNDKKPSVFIFSDIIIENEMKKDYRKTGQCRVFLLKEKVLVRRNALFLQKNSPWTPSFDEQILLLRQHGLGSYLEGKYKTFTAGKCSINEQELRKREYNGPIGFYHIKAAFYVLAAGLFMSFIAFVSENIFFRRSHNVRKRANSVECRRE